MRVTLDSIGPAGRDVAVSASDAWALEAVSAALDSQPSALAGQIQIAPPRQRLIDVSVDVTTTATVHCDRCGEPATLDLRVESDLLYRPMGADGDDRELASEELDVGWYVDRSLDLAAVLAEAVALTIPPRKTCKDAEACEVRTDAMLAKQRPTGDVGHPGFAALRTISE